jgi:hypothetical protein
MATTRLPVTAPGPAATWSRSWTGSPPGMATSSRTRRAGRSASGRGLSIGKVPEGAWTIAIDPQKDSWALHARDRVGTSKAMNARSVTVAIERVGYPPDVREGMQDDYAADIIRGMVTQPDVMITVSCSSAAERVMLAISDGKSFAGLAGSSGEIY